MPIDITDQPRRAQYAISGTGPYDFDFEVLAQTDVAIYRDATLLTLTTDYTVVVNADGTGAVTLVSATGTTLTIIGARPYARLTDYSTGGDFTADTMNDELDSHQIQILQLDERIDRAFTVSPTSTFAGGVEFPDPGAGYYIRWNAAGTALEAVSAVNDPGSVTIGTYTRSVTAELGDRVSVLRYIPTNLHAGIRDGSGTTPLDAYVQAARDANKGRTVFFPAGLYYLTEVLKVGGTTFEYHSMQGEGPAIYADNSDYPRTILYFHNSSGVQIWNAYQHFEGFAIIGTQAGSSDPTTGVLADLKRIGLSLSTVGATTHGGYSRIRNISVSSFDTNVAVQPGSFLAYSDLENISAFSGITNFALVGSITDLNFRGGVCVDATSGRGVITLGAARVKFHATLFETSGTLAVDKDKSAICALDESHITLIGCGLQDNTNYFCDYDAVLETIGCTPVGDCKFCGSGKFIFNDTLGTAVDIPVPEPDAWTLSNVTVTATHSAAHPASYRIQSSSAAASIQLSVEIALSSVVKGLDRKGLVKTINDVRDYLALEYEIVFEQTVIPAAWTGLEGFLPGLSAMCFGAGGSDSWEAVDSDTTASVFANLKVVRINQVFPLTWSAAALNGTLEKFRIFLSFSDGSVKGYDVNALNAYMTRPKLTYFQRNRES